MKRIIALTFVMIFTVMAYSTPTWMWIGRFNLLTITTPCGSSTRNAMAQYNEFFTAAQNNHPNGPAPYENEKVLGSDVTWSTVRACSLSSSDFLFFQSHGLEDAHSMGVLTDDKKWCYWWQPYMMRLGRYVYGTRWAYFETCELCKWHDHFWENWNDAFRGVAGESAFFTETIRNFWEEWTGAHGPQQTLWQAHYWSSYHGMYENGWNISPVTISSSRINSPHFFMYDTYDNATSEAGDWLAAICQYDVLIH